MKLRQKENLIELLPEPEYRQAFFDSRLNTSIAAQIRANREARGLSQEEFGALVPGGKPGGMKQSRISAMENVDYERWSISSLRRLAAAFDLVLSVRFESFGKSMLQLESFEQDLVQPSFERDPAFRREVPTAPDATVIDHLVQTGIAANDNLALTTEQTPLAPTRYEKDATAALESILEAS